ncbi:DNA repair protein RadC [Luteimonas sp. MC1825]|nr:DNA repair protein RadC [Luteimonas sp. MC1825]QOC87984.1 DNA repair protein RadC [Luteimonas sp. MC1825]
MMDVDEGHEPRLYVRSSTKRYKVATPDEVLEAARTVVGHRMQRGTSFANPKTSKDFFRGKLAGLQQEVFAAAFLDARHRLIEYVELFHGTIDGAEVHPREVVRQAIRTNSAAVIVSHNHPSGSAMPSAADRAVTARLKQALALVDVRLIDHVVVGGLETVALAERGMIYRDARQGRIASLPGSSKTIFFALLGNVDSTLLTSVLRLHSLLPMGMGGAE